MRGQQRVWGFFAHTGIIIGMMFVVFFVIDQFNPAMEFLTGSISKDLMLCLAIVSVIDGIFSAAMLYQKQKRQEEKRGKKNTASARNNAAFAARSAPERNVADVPRYPALPSQYQQERENVYAPRYPTPQAQYPNQAGSPRRGPMQGR